MKSAYELALERLKAQGIEPPREEGLAPALRDQVAEVRSKAEAKIAELEILHQGRLKALLDPGQREEEEEDYRRERRRIEQDRDDKVARLRQGS